MNLNFNNSNNIFLKPLVNSNDFNTVFETNKKEIKNTTPKKESHNTDLLEDLESASNFNKSTINVDSKSEYAVSSFESLVQSNTYTPEELISLHGQFNLQVSNLSPQEKQQLDTALYSALFNSFKPIISMDDQSRSAIDNFKSALNSSLTKDEMDFKNFYFNLDNKINVMSNLEND